MPSQTRREVFAAAAPVAPAARSQIEDAIRRWDAARRREASAAGLMDDEDLEDLPDDQSQPLFDWYSDQYGELSDATAGLVTLLRAAGLRAYALDGVLYADTSMDLDVFDSDMSNAPNIAAIPLGAVAVAS